MGVPHGYASLDKPGLDRAGIGAECPSDGREGLAVLVAPDGFVDQVRMQAAPCLDAVALEDLGDGRSVDAVLARKLTLRRTGLVPLDQIALVLGGQMDLALTFGG